MRGMNLPVHWKAVRLGDYIFKPEYGYTASATHETIGPKFLRITDIQDDSVDWKDVPYCECDENTKRKYLLVPGDIVIARIGATTGKAYLVDDSPESIFASYLIRVKTQSSLFSPFLFTYFRTEDYWRQIRQSKGGRLKGGVNIPILQNLKIPLPPLPEQRAIAHILQTIQEAKAARQRELALERERKAALMDYLFSHGTNGESRKQTEIGEIPESWELVELGDLIDVKHGYAFKSEYFTESGDIVLTPGNFLVTGGLYWGVKTKFTSQEYPAEFLFEPGDLVVVMTDLTPSTKLLGASAFIPTGKRVSHNQRIGKILLKNSLTSKNFLYWVFNSKAFRKHMALTATGSTVRHTSPSRIKDYKFGLPLNEEQHEITEILKAFDTKIAALEQEVARLAELFHAMLDELMTGQRSAVPLIDAELPN